MWSFLAELWEACLAFVNVSLVHGLVAVSPQLSKVYDLQSELMDWFEQFLTSMGGRQCCWLL